MAVVTCLWAGGCAVRLHRCVHKCHTCAHRASLLTSRTSLRALQDDAPTRSHRGTEGPGHSGGDGEGNAEGEGAEWGAGWGRRAARRGRAGAGAGAGAVGLHGAGLGDATQLLPPDLLPPLPDFGLLQAPAGAGWESSNNTPALGPLPPLPPLPADMQHVRLGGLRDLPGSSRGQGRGPLRFRLGRGARAE